MGKMFPNIIAHAKFFFQDLHGKGPSLMSIGSNATANGYIYYLLKCKKKILRIGLVAILSLNAANIRMNLKHKHALV